MPTPLPGIDPYLEHPGLWEDVHTPLIVAIADVLGPQVRPKFGLREPIPDIPVPLRPGEIEPILPLNQVLHDLYDRAGYDQVVDYRQPAVPPLSTEDAAWAAQLVR